MKRSDISTADDADLLARFTTGRDMRAFTELVSRHQEMVMATARRVVSCEHDAEEACQAAFLSLAMSADGLRKPAALAGWLHRVATTCAQKIQIANHRWQTKVNRMKEHADGMHQSDTDSSDEMDELRKVLDAELAKFPTKLHVVLVMCDLLGVTQREAAQRLGIGSSTVSDRLKEGRKLLRDRLIRKGVTLGVGGLSACITIAGDQANAAAATSIAQQAVQLASHQPGAGATEASVRVTKVATEVVNQLSRARLASYGAGVTLVLALLIGVPTLLANVWPDQSQTAATGNFYYEDFNDGQIADGSPVTWTPSPNQTGSVDASSGDLVVGFTDETLRDYGVAIGVNDENMRNVSARTRTRVTATDAGAFIAVRGTEGKISGYGVGIGHAKAFGGNFAVFTKADGVSLKPVPPLGSKLPLLRLPYDVRRNDTFIQIDAIGDVIEARCWKAGSPMPRDPQFRLTDDSYPVGGVGVGLRNSSIGPRTKANAIFRFVHVAPEPILDDPTEEDTVGN